MIIISFIVVVCFSLSDAVFLKKSTITAIGGVLDYQAGIMYVATPVSASEAVSKNYADTMKAADSDLLDGQDILYFAVYNDVQNATSTLRTDLTTEISATNTDFNNVATDTTTIQSNLDTLATNVATDTTTIQGNLDTEISATNTDFTNIATDTTTLKTEIDLKQNELSTDTWKAFDSDNLDGRNFDAFVSTAGDTMSGQLTMSGTTANISLGSNYLSGDGDDEGVFIYDDGIVSLPLQSAVRAKTVDIQLNLSDGVATKVVFGLEDFDIQGEFADSRFTAKRAGYYQISTSVIWYGPSTVADKGYNLVFRKNGSDISGSYSIIAPAITAYFSNNITDIVYLAVDEYIEVFATSNAGVDTVDIWGGFFAIHKLS